MPRVSGYPIPGRETRLETRVSNSRFLAILAEARTADEAHAFVRALKAELADASAHAYAFRAGYGGSVTEGVSDGGEPSGTAGKPMLAVLRGEDLGDVVAVVVRWFGGTKLGTGGLVRAFSGALKDALAVLPRAQRIPRCSGAVAIPYPLYERLKLLVAAHEGAITHEDFAAAITLGLILPQARCAAFDTALATLSGGGARVAWTPLP